MKSQIIAAAAGLLLTMGVHAQDTIYGGSGFGTYYYDVENPQVCNTDFTSMNTGQVECSLTQEWSLGNVNSNYLVAMNHSQLVEDMGKYCGKRVIVTVNGVASDLPLFIGDGCQRCGTGSSSSTTWDPNGAPGLDFSYGVLSELSSSACSAGHIDISWEIVDETIYNFDYSGAGTPQGPVSGSSAAAPPPPGPSAATTQAPAPTTAAPPPAPPAVTSVPTQVVNPIVPTTLLTVTRTSTVDLVSETHPATQGGSPTNSNPSSPCSTGAWQCNGIVLEQCLTGAWAPRVTCQAGMTCQGGATPYCAPPGFGELAPPTPS